MTESGEVRDDVRIDGEITKEVSFWEGEVGKERLRVVKEVWSAVGKIMHEELGTKVEDFDLQNIVAGDFEELGKDVNAGGTYSVVEGKIYLNTRFCEKSLDNLAYVMGHEMGHYYGWVRNQKFVDEDNKLVGTRVLRVGMSHPRQFSKFPNAVYNVFNEAVTETTMMRILDKAAADIEGIGVGFEPTAYGEARFMLKNLIENLEIGCKYEKRYDEIYAMFEKACWGERGGIRELRRFIESVYGREGRLEIEHLSAEIGDPRDVNVRLAKDLDQLIRKPSLELTTANPGVVEYQLSDMRINIDFSKIKDEDFWEMLKQLPGWVGQRQLVEQVDELCDLYDNPLPTAEEVLNNWKLMDKLDNLVAYGFDQALVKSTRVSEFRYLDDSSRTLVSWGKSEVLKLFKEAVGVSESAYDIDGLDKDRTVKYYSIEGRNDIEYVEIYFGPWDDQKAMVGMFVSRERRVS